ncbi:heavy-metal-associated domain-containing protein [Variovorax sp. J22R133]|uniref:heavy-metal-associated domain-containing protein n=1 Tax=Variovorax brevis TaxID=3053503 RepID=UPI002575B2BD|nr:heavy-metal-associated domain-containing protein [Variovorax sp. J22R133]MDM0111699.1 heavy-metal-associated domain-containing protein [Variovorax sp. J22R133]
MSQELQVEGMSCAHCVSAVQKAILAIDPQAEVRVDLETGRLETSSEQPREALIAAVANAGYEAR